MLKVSFEGEKFNQKSRFGHWWIKNVSMIDFWCRSKSRSFKAFQLAGHKVLFSQNLSFLSIPGIFCGPNMLGKRWFFLPIVVDAVAELRNMYHYWYTNDICLFLFIFKFLIGNANSNFPEKTTWSDAPHVAF